MSEYADSEGNVLVLRDSVSEKTLERVRTERGRAGASREDVWQRRQEMLFEALAESWTIAGLPLTSQKELLGRYRMASSAERAWIHETVAAHLGERYPAD